MEVATGREAYRDECEDKPTGMNAKIEKLEEERILFS